MMHMEQRLAQRQQLVLTQKMQQALHILQLSGLELEQYVQQELEANPFLEQVQSREEMPERPAEAPTQTTSDEQEYFQESNDFDDWATRWKEGQDLSRNTDMDARRQFYEDSITKEESLRAHLLDQLRLMTDDEQVYHIGERIIIGDIDEKGYFTGDCGAIAQELEVPLAKVEEALDCIQQMEPTGVGARDVVECLLMQIEAEYPQEEQLRVLVRDHFEELKRRQIPQIAKAMRVAPERVEQLKDLLATLNPWPGHEYAGGPPQYVQPDIVVEKVDDEFIVRLVDEKIPNLRINDNFHKSVKQNGGMSSEDKDYVRQKMESARWLTRNIAQRQQTILKVGEAITRVQHDFMEKGIEHIKPLTLQVIADEIGVHESTVARATRGKYMQTPQGLFELKFFFSPGLKSDVGEDQSSKSVQAALKKIIEDEDKRKPLSDQKIADMLKKQGTNIARRTVTKYREGLGIPATTMRKQY